MSDSHDPLHDSAAKPERAKPIEVRVRRNLADRLRDTATYIKWGGSVVVLCLLVVGGYYAYAWITGLPGLFDVVGKPLECPSTMELRGLICYEKCPEGWQSDGTNTCYQPCPADWAGTQTLTHCQHKTIASSVGADSAQSIPKGCAPGKLDYAGLCYTVPAGWHVTAPGFVGKVCPAGWRDDGTTCWLDADSYGRGGGQIESACRSDHGSCEQWGLLWYPTCRPGYSARGCCICGRDPQTQSKSVRSEVGTLPDACPAGRQLVGRLCYPECPAGYERRGDDLESCATVCPAGFTNIGIGGCQKPSKGVEGKGLTVAGVCPADFPVRKGDLCYKPDS